MKRVHGFLLMPLLVFVIILSSCNPFITPVNNVGGKGNLQLKIAIEGNVETVSHFNVDLTSKSGNYSAGFRITELKNGVITLSGISADSWSGKLIACDSYGRAISSVALKFNISANKTTYVNCSFDFDEILGNLTLDFKGDLDMAKASLVLVGPDGHVQRRRVHGAFPEIETLSGLPEGMWSAVLYCYDTDGMVIATGEADTYVTGGKNSHLDLYLHMLNVSDIGNVAVDVHSAIPGIEEYRISLVNSYGFEIGPYTCVAVEGNAETLVDKVPVGEWIVKAEALDVLGNVVSSGSTPVYVMGNLTAPATIYIHESGDVGFLSVTADIHKGRVQMEISQNGIFIDDVEFHQWDYMRDKSCLVALNPGHYRCELTIDDMSQKRSRTAYFDIEAGKTSSITINGSNISCVKPSRIAAFSLLESESEDGKLKYFKADLENIDDIGLWKIEWYLDGAVVPYYNATEMMLDSSNLKVGNHELSFCMSRGDERLMSVAAFTAFHDGVTGIVTGVPESVLTLDDSFEVTVGLGSDVESYEKYWSVNGKRIEETGTGKLNVVLDRDCLAESLSNGSLDVSLNAIVDEWRDEAICIWEKRIPVYIDAVTMSLDVDVIDSGEEVVISFNGLNPVYNESMSASVYWSLPDGQIRNWMGRFHYDGVLHLPVVDVPSGDVVLSTELYYKGNWIASAGSATINVRDKYDIHIDDTDPIVMKRLTENTVELIDAPDVTGWSFKWYLDNTLVSEEKVCRCTPDVYPGNYELRCEAFNPEGMKLVSNPVPVTVVLKEPKAVMDVSFDEYEIKSAYIEITSELDPLDTVEVAEYRLQIGLGSNGAFHDVVLSEFNGRHHTSIPVEDLNGVPDFRVKGILLDGEGAVIAENIVYEGIGSRLFHDNYGYHDYYEVRYGQDYLDVNLYANSAGNLRFSPYDWDWKWYVGDSNKPAATGHPGRFGVNIWPVGTYEYGHQRIRYEAVRKSDGIKIDGNVNLTIRCNEEHWR